MRWVQGRVRVLLGMAVLVFASALLTSPPASAAVRYVRHCYWHHFHRHCYYQRHYYHRQYRHSYCYYHRCYYYYPHHRSGWNSR